MLSEAIDFVGFINRHHSFGATSGEMVEELREDSDILPLDISTKLEKSVKGFIESSHVRLIVLTGDAGQGKTHLCRRILMEYGLPRDEAKSAISDRCNGEHTLLITSTGKELRIIKDLSEFNYSDGFLRISKALACSQTVLLLCANEGRLRAVLSESNPIAEQPELMKVGKLMNDSFTLGVAANRNDPEIRIIDLNRQSVTQGENPFALETIKYFAASSAWEGCSECDSHNVCPIKRNRDSLVDDKQGEKMRGALLMLLTTVERCGFTVTKRQCLALVAWALTGNLTCKTVRNRLDKTIRDDPGKWSLQEIIFGSLDNEKEIDRLPLLESIRKLDPGKNADPYLDQQIMESIGDNECMANGFVRSHLELRRHGARLRDIYRRERRRNFFENFEPSKAGKMMGLVHFDAFNNLMLNSPPQSIIVEARNILAAGLEAAQGLRRHGAQNSGKFCIVDPAFSSGRSGVAVISDIIDLPLIKLVERSAFWKLSLQNSDVEIICSYVDWLPRELVLYRDSGDLKTAIVMDLPMFELLGRMATGLITPIAMREIQTKLEFSLWHWSQKQGDRINTLKLCVDGQLKTLQIYPNEPIQEVNA